MLILVLHGHRGHHVLALKDKIQGQMIFLGNPISYRWAGKTCPHLVHSQLTFLVRALCCLIHIFLGVILVLLLSFWSFLQVVVGSWFMSNVLWYLESTEALQTPSLSLLKVLKVWVSFYICGLLHRKKNIGSLEKALILLSVIHFRTPFSRHPFPFSPSLPCSVFKLFNSRCPLFTGS